MNLWKLVLASTLLLATPELGKAGTIVGGEAAGVEEFPFVAKILYGNHVGCTGTLISLDRVLTAGHCVDRYELRRLSVGFGSSRESGPLYQVVEKILHPQYSTQQNDIAILRLDRPVTGITPVQLLTLQDELRHAPSGGLVSAVGWGSTTRGEGSSLPERLQVIHGIPMYTEEDCKAKLQDLRRQGKEPQPPSIHQKVLCAGEEDRASGRGDSGGPLLTQTPHGWNQIGVLSQASAVTQNRPMVVT